MFKSSEEFQMLTDAEKTREYADLKGVADGFAVLHRNDEFLRATLSGGLLARVIFNGKEAPTRKDIDELIRLLKVQRGTAK